MKHVVMFSGGVTSWAAARRVADLYGTNDMTLLFADTLVEDYDTYRFLDDAASDIGLPVTRVCDGRTPWQVFVDEGFIGNSRVDPCSKILKRKLLDKWRNANCDSSDTIVHVGIHWDEQERLDRLRKRVVPWNYQAPLCWEPYWPHSDCMELAQSRGLVVPRMYAWKFPHGNCGGACVKAGQASWAILLRFNRERYLEEERQELDAQKIIGTTCTILKDRRGGVTRPMTLREFRERIEAQTIDPSLDQTSGCGCGLGV